MIGRLNLGGAILLSGVMLVSSVSANPLESSPRVTLTAGSNPSASPRHASIPEGAEKSSLTVTPDYIIGPEDVLEITVWKNADLSKQVQVRPDGRISLPLIGDVSAVGRTAAQLTEEISSRLKSYMENPTVSIVVREVNSYQIYVLGEVNAPGKYPLKSKTTLLQAITIARGFTQVAARNKIVVFRFGKDGEGLNKIKASYDDIVLRDGSDQNIELKPGDQIVVPSETMVVLPTR
ncbi:MAG: polysaccharide biosynthesis/export family protein [Nitrospiraceae bacterium]|nr:polysaccharide biosynthesis/export family protein [Nitrospiraceae bacterium]